MCSSEVQKCFCVSSLCVAKICGEDGMVDPNCFVFAQSVVFAILEDEWVSVVFFLYCLLCEVPITALPPQHLRYRLSSPPTRSLIFRHFSEFLRSHHFCKYQIEVLTSGSVFLADILFCESALFYFSEVSGPNLHVLLLLLFFGFKHTVGISCWLLVVERTNIKMYQNTHKEGFIY